MTHQQRRSTLHDYYTRYYHLLHNKECHIVHPLLFSTPPPKTESDLPLAGASAVLDRRAEPLEFFEIQLAAPVGVHLLKPLAKVVVGAVVAFLAEAHQLAEFIKVDLVVAVAYCSDVLHVFVDQRRACDDVAGAVIVYIGYIGYIGFDDVAGAVRPIAYQRVGRLSRMQTPHSATAAEQETAWVRLHTLQRRFDYIRGIRHTLQRGFGCRHRYARAPPSRPAAGTCRTR